MAEIDQTQFFKFDVERPVTPKEVLEVVYNANVEKGYDPVNQITGYLVSDDPTFITSHNDARKLIRRLERDEIIEELLNSYAKQNGWHK